MQVAPDQDGVALITGGCGFVGRRLSKRLLDDGAAARVVLFDVLPPRDPLLLAEAYEPGRTQDRHRVAECLLKHRPSVVFHLAAYGMSGAASLDRQGTWEVNVEGTRSVIAGCAAAGVPRLVHTSTCNVVFGGRPIHGGDESLPYFPLHRHKDHYSRTKAVAEMAVLAADGTPLAPQPAPVPAGDGRTAGGALSKGGLASSSSAAAGERRRAPALLRTCALRPNGIYGAGEEQHSMRVLDMAQRGLFVFTFGAPGGAVQDWTHVDNLVQAELLAAAALTEARGFVAGGQAYFVVDPKPCDSQLMMRPLLEGLGYRAPSLRLPTWLVYALAAAMELLHRLLPRRLGWRPPLTRSEVCKAAVTHFFSSAKAARDLGYSPKPYSAAEYLPWFVERGFGAGPGGRRDFVSSQQLQRQALLRSRPGSGAGGGGAAPG